AVPEVSVRQLHHDQEPALDQVVTLNRKDVGMADCLDAVERLQFLKGSSAILIDSLDVTVNELDGLGKASGRFHSPAFAKAAAAKPLDKLVTRNGLSAAFDAERHVTPF